MSRVHVLALTSFLGLTVSTTTAATPVLRVVHGNRTGKPLLTNGDFEKQHGGTALNWQPGPKGYRLAAGAGRSDSAAIVCENSAGTGWFGAAQSLALNRTSTAPIVVRGWSKALNVTGSADSGYSLYVDLVYQDGSPLWGRTGNFRCGTHDWEQREFVILPDKPVKSLTLHCLFRGHGGKAWFDDVSVEEVKAEGGAALFQGVPVVAADEIPPTKSKAAPTISKSGISSIKSSGRMTQGSDAWNEIASALMNSDPQRMFLARDVAADSDFFACADGACRDLDLKVETRLDARGDHFVVDGRISSTVPRDRAITLIFALPLDATGWRWGDDIRRNRPIQGKGEFVNQVAVRCGSTGTMSLYPVGAVWNDRTGVALALDMARPAVYRVGYQAGLKRLFIAYDFGLAPAGQSPNSRSGQTARESHPLTADGDKSVREAGAGIAGFRFVIYRFDPKWGFRAAWQRYMDIFPDYFVVRAKDQGLWMPFTDVSKVEGWRDFGFKFHEGNNDVPWDDAHGILSFRYTEPMTWWMPMKKELPRTIAEALRVRDELAGSGNASQRRMAEVSRVAAMFDESGAPALLFRNEPWCNGAVWSLNPNPYLKPTPAAMPSNPSQTTPSKRDAMEGVPLNAATIHWNPALKDRLYGPAAKGRLDGEYLDSLEGYVTADLNYRREQFGDTTVPLTFGSETKQPALFKGLAVFEFTKWMSDDAHRMGRLMFANGVPYRFTFLCPWLDVLGTETDWLRDGKYAPASGPTMDLWRTASGAKPYLLLMNTDYDRFTPDLVEKYFQRALFYGMWPGFFSHNAADNPYWQNPKWYNRDRPLFRKYIPIIKRIAGAGWRPVTEATCDNERIWIERFGPDAEGTVYLTLFNDTAALQRGVVSFESRLLHGKTLTVVRELIRGSHTERSQRGWAAELAPQEAAVFEIK